MAKNRSPPRRKTPKDYSVYREKMLEMYNKLRTQGYKKTPALEKTAKHFGTYRSVIQGQVFPEFRRRRNRETKIRDSNRDRSGQKISDNVNYFIRSNFPKVLEEIFTPNEALYLSDISNRIRDYSIREKDYDYVIKDTTIIALDRKQHKPLIELIETGDRHDLNLYSLVK